MGLDTETFSRNVTLILTESIESCSCEECEAGSGGWAQFRKRKEGEGPPLKATTKQRLVKTEKTLYAVVK
jgi:hypothetical protein